MGTLLKCNIDIERERQKTERQKDNKTKDDDRGVVSSRFLDLLNSIIYDIKRCADLR